MHKAEQSSANLNDSFFNGLYREVWRKLMPAGLTQAEVEFLVEEGGLKAGSCVLDLMCGYGRHALELARQACLVTAIDNSADYIEEIRATATRESLPLTAVCESAALVPLEGPFDLAFCLGNSFAFFGEADAQAILHRVSAALKPGAKFIIGSWMIAEVAVRHFKERDWFYVDDYKYVVENNFCFGPSRIESDHTLVLPDGSWQSIKGIDYIFSIAELEALCGRAGLRLSGLYSTPRRKKFQLGASQIYFVAEKS